MTPVWPINGGRGIKLTGYLDSPHMLSQYLLIYSEAIKATRKEIWGINSKAAIYDRSLAHKGGSGGKTDRLFRLSIYAFPIPLNTFWSYKSNNKGDIRQKLKISYFITPVWPIRGGPWGKTDRLFKLSTYGFLLPPSTIYSSKCNTSEDNKGG